ncbi:DNA-binding LytR/AlgR family response regulator [Pedobacter sp. UYP30]|uniref:LytR/AlgR family response regulator transcription factor n=1 Tax=Pedobacter sp. UYP30 TaxID=1756400 RepID=UPI003395A4F4
MPFNCIVIDDEVAAIEEISEYIIDSPHLELLRAFTMPQEALSFIKSTSNIDIVFLDMNMPFMNGSELGFLIRENTDLLIFTTSHAKSALDAFEVSADAFLLKPFNFPKFISVVQRACDRLDSKRIKNDSLEYIFVKNKDDNLKLVKIFLADIVAIESLLNYIRIYTLHGKLVTHLSLKEAKDSFNLNRGFIQMHRSFIISERHIVSLENCKVTMSDGSTFNIGNNFKNQLNDILTKHLLKSSHKT